MTTRAPPDPELLDRVRRGDDAALAALYDRHAGRLLAIGRGLLRDTQAAEDLVHDVFLAAWRDAARFDPTRGSVRTWLCVRMRSRCLDRLRHHTVRDRVHDSLSSPVSHHPDPALLDTTLLEPLLERLPAPQRQALTLRYLQGMSSQQAAEAMACPVGTVKSRVRSGLQALRDQLTPPPRVSV